MLQAAQGRVGWGGVGQGGQGGAGRGEARRVQSRAGQGGVGWGGLAQGEGQVRTESVRFLVRLARITLRTCQWIPVGWCFRL